MLSQSVPVKILFLYTEVMPYTLSTIKCLLHAAAEVHVVYWDTKKLTPFFPTPLPGAFFYKRSFFNSYSLLALTNKLQPDITLVSGWQDNAYLYVSFRLRANNYKVVCGLDGHKFLTLKKLFASIIAKFGCFSFFFSHAWVAGPYQYEYARMLGFKKEAIIFDLYSADLSLFDLTYRNRIASVHIDYPHRFLFVGRFEHIKGIDILLDSWHSLNLERKDWELHLIGNGSNCLESNRHCGIIVKSFMTSESLSNEALNAGCFVLPSRFEPWGVVVHEFASAGLPLILSDSVGSSSTFLINGMNGYKFSAGTNPVASLSNALLKVINSSDSTLFDFGSFSNSLSKRITPVTSAMNLLSIL